MLTNPPSSSTSVTSSSLVEVTSTSITSPSLPSSTAATPTTSTPLVATTQETTAVPTTSLLNSKSPQAPKRKKKAAKPQGGITIAPSPGAEVISSSLVASTSAPPPPPPPITTGNNGNANNGRKRSRKQEINLLRDSSEISPSLDSKAELGKSGKRRKNVAGNPVNISNDSLSKQSNVPKTKQAKGSTSASTTSKSASGTGRVSKSKKISVSSTVTSTDNSIVSFDPQQKIVLRQNEFIDPSLSFTIFSDLSRGLGAIGPSQVILAVESTREKGTSEELLNDLGANKPSKQGFSCQLFSLFLSVPHFLPLRSVYSSGEPFARILRYSALEEYTNGALGKNQVSTFRFYGPRYEKQVPTLSASQEKNPKVVQLRKKITKPNAYLRSFLIIKHPILGFYSRKLVNLKFVVLKKIHFRDTAAVIGHLKSKVVQLRRSADLKNIEIYVDETRVPEAASDVNAMNQQNLQPVIQTPSGLVPLIARTSYQAQPDYQLIEQQPLIHQTEPQQFQYVQYQYQDASELAQEIGSNLILNFDNSSGEYISNPPTFRDETGAQVLILSPATEIHSTPRYLQAHQQQPQQQIIQHHQVPQEQQANFYSGQEQQIIVQQHTQQLSASQQLQLQQQQQAYTIQQQEQQQQIIQIQPDAQKGQPRQILFLPGTNIPIEIHFEGNTSAAPAVIAEPLQSTRVYTQQQPEQQIQIQAHPQQPQQQFRSGQQIVVQQHTPTPNQNHFQAVHQQQQQQILSTQNPVVIRQQQQQQVQVVGQTSAATTQQTYQYRNVSQQQQVVVQQQQALSSCVQQAHHHQTQLNQIQAPQQHSPQVRFQSVHQQQQVQPLLHPQQGQTRPPALQSPPHTTPVPPSTALFQQQQQRPAFQQNQSQYQQVRPPIPTPTPQQSVSPSKQKKPKQPKGSKKNATGEGAPLINQSPTDLTPQQLEQLRHREQKGADSGFQPSPTQQAPPQTPAAVGQPLPAPLGPVPPNFIPPRFANTSQGVTPTPIISPQQQQQSLAAQYTPAPAKKSGQKSRSQRPPVPPPPIISSSASLAHFPSVSSGTTQVAPKSQVPSGSSTLAFSSSAPALQQQQQSPKKQPKTFVVVSSPPSSGLKAVPPPAPLPPKQEFKTKPGQLAVCPHCGVGNQNILRCNRCKRELPADVKFIKDGWYVSKAGAAVAVPAPKPSPPTGGHSSPAPSISLSSDNNNSSGKVLTSTNIKTNAKTGVAGRKILLVNKPQPPSPAVQVSSTTGAVTNNKTVVAPGTVHIQIQPDGGSAVTINSGGGSVVQTKSTPLVVAKPAPKRRAPARKRQAHECITLSSDDEDPEPPVTKVAKQEEKPAASTTAVTSASAAVLASSSKSNIQSSTTTVTSSTATATSVKNTTTNTSVSKVSSSASTSQNQTSDSAALIKKEAEKQLTTASNSSATQPQDNNMQKQFKINIDLDHTAKPVTAEKLTEDGPNEINAKIELEMGKIGNKFEYATFVCRSIRVGSYKVTSSDTGFAIPVQFTELGLKFNMPHANYKHKNVKMCIPMDCILDIKGHFNKRLQVFFITTGPRYAVWVRSTLGLDGSSANESSNYFCPMNGLPCQKTITMLGEEVLEESDIGTIKKLYGNVLTEMQDSVAVNDLLMKVTPQSFRSSLGYSASESSTSSGTSAGLKIVSTSSMAAGPVSSANSSQASNISTSSTVILQKDENSASTASPALDNDGDGVILFYEGRNSIKVPICPNDIKCLAYSQFLNDQIIDFWMAVIQTEIMKEEDKNRTFFFDSFFYSKLTEKMRRKNEEDGNLTAGERRHGRVKKRTKNVDIFSKDFLIVPINENYHWFIAIICFPGLEGYHDYNSLEPLPNYKRPRMLTSKASSTNNNKKPVVYNQPKNDTTAAYSSRDEAPEDPEENDQISSPDTPGTEGAESKSQTKTDAGEPNSEKGPSVAPGTKRKSEFGQAVKHPCILIFDSLVGEPRGRIYSTLREYLRIEYKTKKNADRVFDKSTMPGVMPKVPQQPNFSDCGLFMLQYVESFFSDPIPNYEPKKINLKQWFPPSMAENKRVDIYNFIVNKVKEKYPQNSNRIPAVNFEPDENDLDLSKEEEEAYMRKHMGHEEADDPDYFEDEDFEDEFDDSEEDEERFRQMVTQKKVANSKQPKKEDQSKPGSDNEDHNYATTPPKPSAATQAASLPTTVVVAITPLPDTSDNATPKKKT